MQKNITGGDYLINLKFNRIIPRYPFSTYAPGSIVVWPPRAEWCREMSGTRTCLILFIKSMPNSVRGRTGIDPEYLFLSSQVYWTAKVDGTTDPGMSNLFIKTLHTLGFICPQHPSSSGVEGMMTGTYSMAVLYIFNYPRKPKLGYQNQPQKSGKSIPSTFHSNLCLESDTAFHPLCLHIDSIH